MGSVEENSLSPPIAAKLDTSTRVLVDSHEGQAVERSRSANDVSISKRCSHASQRYS